MMKVYFLIIREIMFKIIFNSFYFFNILLFGRIFNYIIKKKKLILKIKFKKNNLFKIKTI